MWSSTSEFLQGFFFAVLVVCGLQWVLLNILWVHLNIGRKKHRELILDDKKEACFPSFIKKKLEQFPEGLQETCDWLNHMINSLFYDHIGITNLTNMCKDSINQELEELQKELNWVVEYIQLKELKLGSSLPKITQCDCKSYNIAQKDMLLELNVHYGGGFSLLVSAELFFGKMVNISVSIERLAAKVIVDVGEKAMVFCAPEEPDMEFKVDMELGSLSLNRIGALITHKVKQFISKSIVHPNVFTYYYRQHDREFAKKLKEDPSLGLSMPSAMIYPKVPVKPGILRLSILSAQNLPMRDSRRLCDPYCVISLVRIKLKTKACYKTSNPIWNETFNIDLYQMAFELARRKLRISNKQQLPDATDPMASLINECLCIAVFDKNIFAKSDFLGCVYLPVKDFPRNEMKHLCYELSSERSKKDPINLAETDLGTKLNIQILFAYSNSSDQKRRSGACNNSSSISNIVKDSDRRRRSIENISISSLPTDYANRIDSLEQWNKFEKETERIRRSSADTLDGFRSRVRNVSKKEKNTIPMEYFEYEILAKLLQDEIDRLLDLQKRLMDMQSYDDDFNLPLRNSSIEKLQTEIKVVQGRIDSLAKEEIELRSRMRAAGWFGHGSDEDITSLDINPSFGSLSDEKQGPIDTLSIQNRLVDLKKNIEENFVSKDGIYPATNSPLVVQEDFHDRLVHVEKPEVICECMAGLLSGQLIIKESWLQFRYNRDVFNSHFLQGRLTKKFKDINDIEEKKVEGYYFRWFAKRLIYSKASHEWIFVSGLIHPEEIVKLESLSTQEVYSKEGSSNDLSRIEYSVIKLTTSLKKTIFLYFRLGDPAWETIKISQFRHSFDSEKSIHAMLNLDFHRIVSLNLQPSDSDTHRYFMLNVMCKAFSQTILDLGFHGEESSLSQFYSSAYNIWKANTELPWDKSEEYFSDVSNVSAHSKTPIFSPSRGGFYQAFHLDETSVLKRISCTITQNSKISSNGTVYLTKSGLFFYARSLMSKIKAVIDFNRINSVMMPTEKSILLKIESVDSLLLDHFESQGVCIELLKEIEQGLNKGYDFEP